MCIIRYNNELRVEEVELEFGYSLRYYVRTGDPDLLIKGKKRKKAGGKKATKQKGKKQEGAQRKKKPHLDTQSLPDIPG